MKDDLAIVAFASAGLVEIVLTLNRRTMASDHAKLTYLMVNRAKGLATPHLITEKDAIRKLASL
jgi:hypothetical protein